STYCLAGGRVSVKNADLREFRSFVWQTLFARSLRLDDFDAVTGAPYAVLEPSWGAMARISLSEVVPDVKVSAEDFDYLIVQTPWPGHLVGRARLIVRYHDAIPIFESHTIQNKVRHQRQHFKGLIDNYR